MFPGGANDKQAEQSRGSSLQEEVHQVEMEPHVQRPLERPRCDQELEAMVGKLRGWGGVVWEEPTTRTELLNSLKRGSEEGSLEGKTCGWAWPAGGHPGSYRDSNTTASGSELGGVKGLRGNLLGSGC